MKTWKATFLVIFIMSLFTYITFLKENPVSCWWWVLGAFFIFQTYMHDVPDEYLDETKEDEKDE